MLPPIIDLNDVEFIGADLRRPECVLTTRKGDIYVSDLRGGVTKLSSDGSETHLIGSVVPQGFITNGFSLEDDGSFLIGNMGQGGGVWRLDPDGQLKLLFDHVDGMPMTHTNFVGRDLFGRHWITVTTQLDVMVHCLTQKSQDGFIVLLDERGPRVVAQGLCVTNEAKVDPSGTWLYVNETFGRRLTRFRICPDTSLGKPETVVTFDDGLFPDGLEHDAHGHVWVAGLVSNRIVRIAPETGRMQTILEDRNDTVIADAERIFATGRAFTREELDNGKLSVLGNAPSVTFGGHDLRTVYVGSLGNGRICRFRTEFQGCAPAHWRL